MRSRERLLFSNGGALTFGSELDRIGASLSGRVNADPERLERGLAQLVMTLIELLRQLVERQAIHRVESGSLSEEEIERLGRSLLALSERMEELKHEFGLSDSDLNLDLGPLGRLM